MSGIKCKVFDSLNQDEINKWLHEGNLKEGDIVGIFQSAQSVTSVREDNTLASIVLGDIKTTIFYKYSC